MTPRPLRIRIRDSLGRIRTLTEGPDSYERLDEGASHSISRCSRPVLLLGIGPHPAQLLPLVRRLQPEDSSVFWLESPDFLDALHDAGATLELPAGWRKIDPAQAALLLPGLIRETSPIMFAYRQGRRLFPEFWGPLLALCLIPDGFSPEHAAPAAPPSVLLPGNASSLLHRELTQALEMEGLSPVHLPDSSVSPSGNHVDLKEFFARLKRQRPSLFLSVNLRGLDPEGRVFHLLRAMGIPVCIWFVDNPWQILSSLRLPWWKDALLLTTDATFLPELRACGAANAEFMPLAASSFFLDPEPAILPPGIRVLFVGRSSFPGKDAFFAAAPRHAEREAEARAMLRRGERPDYHWWKRRIEEEQGKHIPSWPGHAAREAGRGTEELALNNRLMWLNEAASLGQNGMPALELVGDEGWKNRLDAPAHFSPPVDYYAMLPALYRAAPFTLDVTSLLLPGGLTQRHFDVWQAGGFLLTATGSGMDIFPPHLAAPITLRRPGDLVLSIKHLEHSPAYKTELRTAWQNEISRNHLYRHRIRAIWERAKKLDATSFRV